MPDLITPVALEGVGLFGVLVWLVLAIDGVLILFGILYTKKKILKRQES